jgi:pyruvate kinase
MSRRARISCTLGPASATPEVVRALVDAGMDVARLNLSHGTRDDHARATALVRAAAQASGRAVAVLADLQGPKIRLGHFRGGTAELAPGAEFLLVPDPIEGDATRAATSYPALGREVAPGDVALIGDGLVKLEVIATDGHAVRTRVVEGGRVSDRKGLNLPGARLSAPALTDKDRGDLEFVLGLPVDLIALSFVRSPDDARPVREAMARAGVTRPVIAKLEKPEALARLEEILDAFDGLLVARGDLGVELPFEQVPMVQKRALRLARERGKPAIVATQMLESMIHATRPTRAEVSDVANAVLDGADCLMLTAETGIGDHPVEAAATMARLIAAAEEAAPLPADPPDVAASPVEPVAEGIAHAAARLARTLGARALVAYTRSGATARYMASRRERVPLYAFTPDEAVRNQLALVWGVESLVVPGARDTDEMVVQVDRSMMAAGHRAGDLVVIVAGSPPGVPGSTNMVRVHRLGSAAG